MKMSWHIINDIYFHVNSDFYLVDDDVRAIKSLWKTKFTLKGTLKLCTNNKNSYDFRVVFR